ncbi:hypothetical protein ACNKHW_25690 [Shigella flexneri]
MVNAPEEGMRADIRVAVQSSKPSISGNGCVPIYRLMEDCGDGSNFPYLEFWQWIPWSKNVEQWQTGDQSLFRQMLGEEMKSLPANWAKTFLPRAF